MLAHVVRVHAASGRNLSRTRSRNLTRVLILGLAVILGRRRDVLLRLRCGGRAAHLRCRLLRRAPPIRPAC